MKLVGLIFVGLCTGFVSGTMFDSFGLSEKRRGRHWEGHWEGHCDKFCDIPYFGTPAYHILSTYNDMKNKASSKPVSTEIASTTKSVYTPVLVSTQMSSEIRNPKFSNSFSSEEKIAKDTNPGTPDEFSTETSSLKSITEITNPKTSNEATIEIFKLKETDGTTEITTPEVSSSVEELKVTEKSTVITNATIPDDFSKENSEATVVTSDTKNSTDPDAHTSDASDETPGVTSDVANSTIPDKNVSKESPSTLTEGTSDVKDSSTPSPPVTTISKSTSDETHVTDSLETSSFTDGISESTNSETSESIISSKTTTERQTTSDEFHSTSPKNKVFMSTDYTTSEKTNSDIEGGSSSTTVPSSSIRPNFLSTTRLHSTETTMNTSPRSQETSLDDTETTHSITTTTIELPGTRTLKLAVSISFLVIALIASVVLVVYFIATRKRTFSYDELMLLP